MFTYDILKTFWNESIKKLLLHARALDSELKFLKQRNHSAIFLRLVLRFIILPLESVNELAYIHQELKRTLSSFGLQQAILLVGSYATNCVERAFQFDPVTYSDIDLALVIDKEEHFKTLNLTLTHQFNQHPYKLKNIYFRSQPHHQFLASYSLELGAISFDLTFYSDSKLALPVKRTDSYKAMVIDLTSRQLISSPSDLLMLLQKKRSFESKDFYDPSILAYIFRELAKREVDIPLEEGCAAQLSQFLQEEKTITSSAKRRYCV